MGMAYWLLKSEPSHYSWDRLGAAGRTPWDGVRNAQALNNLRAMQRGERAFFYHSNEGREIVGVVEGAEPFYPDPNGARGQAGQGRGEAVVAGGAAGRARRDEGR